MIAFIEDSLPTIWNTRASIIMDKPTLTNYIQYMIYRYCPDNKNTCIEKNAPHIVSAIDHYIQQHLFNIIEIIVKQDLPPLFQTTQSHVNGILAHFSHYLHLNNTTTSANAIMMQHSFENSMELIAQLQSVIHLYHPSLEDSSLLKYTLLAKVEEEED
jgi:hypothetical protein